MTLASKTKLSLWHRLRSTPNIPLALVLWLLCLTPFIFWPPFIRSWLYSTLTMSKVFASLYWPSPSPRPWGLRIWDETHPLSVFIATLFFPVVAPIFMVWLLDLVRIWQTDTVSGGPLPVVQLLSATLFGAVATSAFLFLQLPRIIRPRIHCCFLISNSQTVNGYEFLGQYEKSQKFTVESGQWVHVRIANVSTMTYHGVSVTCRLPEGWFAAQVINTNHPHLRVGLHSGVTVDVSPGSRPRYFRVYEYYESTRHVFYQPNNDPRETGSGASAIYSFYVVPPRFSGDGTIEVHVSSDEAVGATVKKLKTIVEPKCLNTEDDLTNGSGVHRS